jgi:hypothetical protein
MAYKDRGKGAGAVANLPPGVPVRVSLVTERIWFPLRWSGRQSADREARASGLSDGLA